MIYGYDPTDDSVIIREGQFQLTFVYDELVKLVQQVTDVRQRVQTEGGQQ